jgi:hypothetical protein
MECNDQAAILNAIVRDVPACRFACGVAVSR